MSEDDTKTYNDNFSFYQFFLSFDLYPFFVPNKPQYDKTKSCRIDIKELNFFSPAFSTIPPRTSIYFLSFTVLRTSTTVIYYVSVIYWKKVLSNRQNKKKLKFFQIISPSWNVWSLKKFQYLHCVKNLPVRSFWFFILTMELHGVSA